MHRLLPLKYTIIFIQSSTTRTYCSTLHINTLHTVGWGLILPLLIQGELFDDLSDLDDEPDLPDLDDEPFLPDLDEVVGQSSPVRAHTVSLIQSE